MLQPRYVYLLTKMLNFMPSMSVLPMASKITLNIDIFQCAVLKLEITVLWQH